MAREIEVNSVGTAGRAEWLRELRPSRAAPPPWPPETLVRLALPCALTASSCEGGNTSCTIKVRKHRKITKRRFAYWTNTTP